MHNTQPLLC